MNPEPAPGNAIAAGPRRASARFMLEHPAHWIALGFGSGLSPKAPGTVGTLWGWATFLLLDRWLDTRAWALLIGASLLVGWWACTRTAQHLRVADPGAIVWDEVVAFWIMLWLLMPAPLWAQALAFALFRLFDAGKPGPVGWADRRFKLRAGQAIGWAQGAGILFDDLVAALCALLVMALGLRLWTW
ncbi:MAG: phosphatidylglycerophosphatase A [Rubrivivax sp.]|nr:phosphatidylglycerophosphatase A [Rubrivivax sp.]